MAQPLDLGDVDPVVHSPARLAIMALLATGDTLEFTLLRDQLALTDGNLNAHLRKLEDAGYVKCTKGFLDRRPRTTYRITAKGRTAFERHVAALERIVKAGQSKGGR